MLLWVLVGVESPSVPGQCRPESGRGRVLGCVGFVGFVIVWCRWFGCAMALARPVRVFLCVRVSLCLLLAGINDDRRHRALETFHLPDHHADLPDAPHPLNCLGKCRPRNNEANDREPTCPQGPG